MNHRSALVGSAAFGIVAGAFALLPVGAHGEEPVAAACADKGIFDEYNARPELASLCPRTGTSPGSDLDGDGIDDLLDITRGARKAVLNGDAYQSAYVTLPYPGGDVPRTMGVCTDVIVRALRNAGVDLQKEVHLDIVRRPAAYPWVKRPDTSIDHRRVRNMMPLFESRWQSHSTEARMVQSESGASSQDWSDFQAGDVVFLDTFPDRPGTEHVGIVSEKKTAEGRPLVVNNWTDGYKTSDMDLLTFVRVTKRYRIASK